jgi:hypothetical protein
MSASAGIEKRKDTAAPRQGLAGSGSTVAGLPSTGWNVPGWAVPG